jgi:hypothetical protein
MNSDRKKPGVVFWATVVLAAVMFYFASFGPAIWVIAHDDLPMEWEVDAFEVVYRPIAWLEENGPEPVSYAIDWYIELWCTRPREFDREPEYIGHQPL